MAVIALTTGVLSQGSNGPSDVTRTTMTASDTLTYTQGSGQMLMLYNTTASAVIVNIVGSAPTPLSPAGYGGTISTAAGKSVAVTANGLKVVELDDIWAFLTGTGTVTITNGTGLTAALVS